MLYVYERAPPTERAHRRRARRVERASSRRASRAASCSRGGVAQGAALYVTVPYYLYRYMVSIKAELQGGQLVRPLRSGGEGAAGGRRRFTRTRACGRRHGVAPGRREGVEGVPRGRRQAHALKKTGDGGAETREAEGR